MLISVGYCWAQNAEICNNVKDGTLLPYPDDCSRYYSCSRGIGWVFSCDPDVFNPETTECDYVERVPKCFEGENGCPKTGHKFIASKHSCKNYYICANGRSFETECAESLLFDKNTERCDKPENVDCSYANPCEGEAEGTFLPGFKCNDYYICYVGKSWLQTCIEGHEYDAEQQKCVESVNGCPVSQF